MLLQTVHAVVQSDPGDQNTFLIKAASEKGGKRTFCFGSRFVEVCILKMTTTWEELFNTANDATGADSATKTNISYTLIMIKHSQEEKRKVTVCIRL